MTAAATLAVDREGGAGLEAVLDGVRRALAEAAGYVDALCGAAASVLATAGAGTTGGTDPVALRRSFAEVADGLGELLLAAGDPDALRAAGAAWVHEVGRPVSALVGLVTDDVLETDDRWTGVAADAYRATFPAQRLALSAVVATCQDVDSGLDDVASAITRFWIAIGSACLGLVVALAGALGSAATVVGVPAATAIAVAGLGALFVALDAALDSLTEISADTASHGVALRRRLDDSTAFPLAAWPRSTVDTDARVSDGDGSDWRPR